MKNLLTILLLSSFIGSASASNKCLNKSIKSIKNEYKSIFKHKRCIQSESEAESCVEHIDEDGITYANACSVFTTDCNGSEDIKFTVLLDAKCEKVYTQYISHEE